ncbi:MAG: methyltransferase domain-containing protein [Chloroflexi bacterium]|nr:methyltransferase domain-containing protein [Chloroflexota bacterium]
MTTTPEDNVRPAIITDISAGMSKIFALKAAMELDLFTPLRDGPMSAHQLAKAARVDAGKLGLLLYVLVFLGLLEVKDGKFSNSPEAQRFLVKGEPGYMGAAQRIWGEMLEAMSKTAESVRTGQAQGKMDFAAMPQERLNNVIRGLLPGAKTAGRALAAAYDFSVYQTLLDVGGGSGGLALAITEVCPQLAVTVVDLPNVTPITQSIIDEAGADSRVRVKTADILAEPLVGSYDVAVMRFVTQVLGAEENARALAHLAQCVRPGGVVYLVAQVLDDSRLAPRPAVTGNLLFLNIYDGGQSYTESEYRRWLTDAGFEDVRRTGLPDGSSVVIARRCA